MTVEERNQRDAEILDYSDRRVIEEIVNVIADVMNDALRTDSLSLPASEAIREIMENRMRQANQALIDAARENLSNLITSQGMTELYEVLLPHHGEPDRYLLPAGTRHHEERVRHGFLVVEREPECRTILVDEEFNKLSNTNYRGKLPRGANLRRKYYLSFPFTYFLIEYQVEETFTPDKLFVFWAPDRIDSLSAPVALFGLTNIYTENSDRGRVCISLSKLDRELTSLTEMAEYTIRKFWNTRFNSDIIETWENAGRAFPTFGSLLSWEEATRNDPSFVLRAAYDLCDDTLVSRMETNRKDRYPAELREFQERINTSCMEVARAAVAGHPPKVDFREKSSRALLTLLQKLFDQIRTKSPDAVRSTIQTFLPAND